MTIYEIPAEDFDLELTLTCGQTFCWYRIDGELYGEGKPEFYTFREGDMVIVEDKGDVIEVETDLPEEKVKETLGIDHDLEKIFETFPSEEPLEKAREEFWGLRIVQDEFFPTLISYLCSPQMRIPRIKEMHNAIAEAYGEEVEYSGVKGYRFPTPGELGEATEDELRELGVGYRAKYIVESTKMMNEGFDPGEVECMEYSQARERMKELYGVGDKVADCVLLFSLGFLDAYPIDTWAQQSLEKHYPELVGEDYEATSENIRDHFGKYSGYAQEYIFHAARNGILEV
ncbi:MAG: DNA-3-methyladenine glycosylase [Candidatus Nanohaloarchaea archaeon]